MDHRTYSLTNEIAESVSDEGSADPSRCGASGGVLLACQGEFPVHQLQKASQFAILLLKILDPEPQSRDPIPNQARGMVREGVQTGWRASLGEPKYCVHTMVQLPSFRGGGEISL